MKDHVIETDNIKHTINESNPRDGWLDNIDENALNQDAKKMESDFADCIDDGLEDLGSADNLF